jgi:DNA-binding MarR family transcriptional regulator
MVARATMRYDAAVRAGDVRHDAWPLLARAHAALVEALDADLQTERSLPLAWFEVLVVLVQAPRGQMRMNDLGAAMLLSKSGITRLVDRLELAGLVARRPCSSDRRVVFAALTARGRATYRSAAPVAARGVERHLVRHLTRAEERAFCSALAKLAAAREARATFE